MDPRRLARVYRVRSLQLTLAQADETHARVALDHESALSNRIRQLADAVAPVPVDVPAPSLAAAAFYRERLQRSAEQAANRVRTAEGEAARRAEATRTAHRDRTAIEKLVERARADAIRAEGKALEDQPPTARNRHDPC